MKSARNARASAAGVPGLKMLLTAGTLAATLGGWAALTAKDVRTAAETLPSPAAMASIGRPALDIASQATPALRVVTLPADAVGPGAPVTVTQSSR